MHKHKKNNISPINTGKIQKRQLNVPFSERPIEYHIPQREYPKKKQSKGIQKIMFLI